MGATASNGRMVGVNGVELRVGSFGDPPAGIGEIGVPTLVVHGADDPLFPLGHALALADDIPGASLLVLERTGHELPPAAWDVVIPAILAHTAGSG